MKTSIPKTVSSLTVAILTIGVTSSCTSSSTHQTQTRASGDPFVASVKPLFEHRCVWCHNHQSPLAGLNLQDREAVTDPKRGFLVPGRPDDSSIYRAVTRDFTHPKVMPGDGWGISQRHRQDLKRWIENGAPWPEGRKGKIIRKSYQVELDDYL